MKHILSGLSLAAMLVVTGAHADSPSRAATPGEKLFIAKVAAAFEAALPPVPSGWVFGEASKPALDMSVDLDSAQTGLQLSYTWHIFSGTREHQEELLQNKMAEHQSLKRDDTGLPKGSSSLQARMDTVSTKLGEAAGKGDTTAMKSYAAELEKLGKLMSLAQDGAAFPIEEQRKFLADTRAHVNINVNGLYVSRSGASKPLGPSAGAAFAFRNERDPADTEPQREGTTTLLYGPWKMNADGDSFEAKPNPARKYPSIQTVTVVIQAEAKRAQALAKSLNSAEILSWLK